MDLHNILFSSKIKGSGGGSGGSGNGATSWNDLTDKPFGEEIATVNEPLNITWDGNTDGLPFVNNFYKVSDLVLTLDQLRLCTITMSFGDQIDLGKAPDSAFFETENLTSFTGFVVSVKADGAVGQGGHVFPEKGLYLLYGSMDMYVASMTSSEPIEHTKAVLTHIDKKYMPFKALLVNVDVTGGASATGTANMTYREVCEMLDNGECFMAFSLDDYSRIQPIKVEGGSRDTHIELICMSENNNGDLRLYWYPDETISMEEPAN